MAICQCMKTQLLMIATAAISLFGLSSCFQVESTISVKKDGSGTITEEMILGDQMKMMMDMAAAQGGQGGPGGKDPMAQMLDKAKAEARAKKMGEGVELVSIKKIDADGKLGVRTIYKFSDINKLKYAVNDAMDMGNMPGGAAKKVDQAENAGLTFEFADGKLAVIQKAPKVEKDGEAPEGDKPAQPAVDPQMMEMVKGMMKDMRITTKLKIEPGIAKTDATHVDGNTIILSDIQMGKLIAMPDKLEALQGGDFDKMKEALKGIEGIKFEDKERISVEMK